MSPTTWLIVIGVAVVLFFMLRGRSRAGVEGPADSQPQDYAPQTQQGHGGHRHGGGGCCG